MVDSFNFFFVLMVDSFNFFFAPVLAVRHSVNPLTKVKGVGRRSEVQVIIILPFPP